MTLNGVDTISTCWIVVYSSVVSTSILKTTTAKCSYFLFPLWYRVRKKRRVILQGQELVTKQKLARIVPFTKFRINLDFVWIIMQGSA